MSENKSAPNDARKPAGGRAAPMREGQRGQKGHAGQVITIVGKDNPPPPPPPPGKSR